MKEIELQLTEQETSFLLQLVSKVGVNVLPARSVYDKLAEKVQERPPLPHS